MFISVPANVGPITIEGTNTNSISLSWEAIGEVDAQGVIQDIVDGYIVYYFPRPTTEAPIRVAASSNPSVRLK